MAGLEEVEAGLSAAIYCTLILYLHLLEVTPVAMVRVVLSDYMFCDRFLSTIDALISMMGDLKVGRTVVLQVQRVSDRGDMIQVRPERDGAPMFPRQDKRQQRWIPLLIGAHPSSCFIPSTL